MEECSKILNSLTKPSDILFLFSFVNWARVSYFAHGSLL